MLVDLLVENYAVIERIRVRFHEGLNVLTGETGSGKSIVVDAVGLLMGARAAAETVRTGAERARISGIFELPSHRGLRALLERAGIEAEDDELLVEREIYPNGKSRAFLASRPVTAAVLRELAPLLGDIHGQHDQQSLLLPAAQLEMLDAFAGAALPAGEVAALFERWRAIQTELAELDRTEQEKLRMADLWSFQKREIEGAALEPDEDATLDRERRVLQNVTRLQDAATAAYAALYDAPESAEVQLRTAIRRLEELARIDASLGESLEALRPALIAVEETARTVGGYLSKLEADPARLEAVESRLAAIDKLKRKYGGGVASILAFLAEVSAQLAAVESAGERRQKLHAEMEGAAAGFRKAAAKLSAARAEAARKLEKKVEAELRSLAMEHAVFRVVLSEAEWSASGADAVAFLVSPNPGEEPRAIEKAASGGEISRIALALKTCIAAPARKETRTLVFDEIDAGIGGRAGEAVGRRLKKIAAANQVLCVTHLPQVAAFAAHHYSVEKRQVSGRTVAEIEELDAPARTREIGRMLSGERLTAEALKNAEQLIRLSGD